MCVEEAKFRPLLSAKCNVLIRRECSNPTLSARANKSFIINNQNSMLHIV